MNPTNFFSFIFLLYFFVPGLFNELLLRRRQEQQKLTTFQEFGNIVAVSTVASTVSAFFTLISLNFFTKDFFKIDELVANPIKYFEENSILCLSLLSGIALIAFTLILIVDAAIIEFQRPRISHTKLYIVLFQNKQPLTLDSMKNPVRKFWRLVFKNLRIGNSKESSNSDLLPVAKIRTCNGDTLVGIVCLFSTSSEPLTGDLLLLPFPHSMLSKLPTAYHFNVSPIPQWQKLHVQGNAISSIEVVYVEFEKNASGQTFIPLL